MKADRKKEPKKVTTIRLSNDLLGRLKEQAEEEGRSLNNLIERKLKQA